MTGSELPEFREFKSIPRLFREVIVTEKIDGTNACVHVADDGVTVTAGSRSRWVTPEADNFGFAAWVKANELELRGLGPGYHYGEWWGRGIQRGYGLGERRFSLFNVGRWGESRPACCHVVPVLYRGPFVEAAIEFVTDRLQELGSVAAPGYMKPEGMVIYHAKANVLFKVTLDGDGHKGAKCSTTEWQRRVDEEARR